MLEFSNYWLKRSNFLGRVYHILRKKARKIFACRVNFCTGRIRSADLPLFSGAAKKRRQNAPSGVVGLFTPDAATIAAGANYLRGYIFDCMFAGIHFCFSGYFCACGKSGLSFLHSILAIVLIRVPGAYLMSRLFPQTLLPMGLATAAGSLFSAIRCTLLYLGLTRRDKASR